MTKPPFFGRVDATGNLKNGTLVSGISMTLISAFVPFTNLDDLISAGILVAFTMTNSSLLLLRRSSPEDSPFLLEVLLVIFHTLSFLLALIVRHFEANWIRILFVTLLSVALVGAITMMALRCKESTKFGAIMQSDHGRLDSTSVVYFQVPCLPYLPLLGAFVNWYLLAQLELSGLLMLLLYFLLAVIGYYSYGYNHSYGNTQGWEYFGLKNEVVISHEGDNTEAENDDTFLHRAISMPQVNYNKEIT